MAPSGGAEFSLVEPSSASFRSSNYRQEKIRDEVEIMSGNYDLIIWFQAQWDNTVKDLLLFNIK